MRQIVAAFPLLAEGIRRFADGVMDAVDATVQDPCYVGDCGQEEIDGFLEGLEKQ